MSVLRFEYVFSPFIHWKRSWKWWWVCVCVCARLPANQVQSSNHNQNWLKWFHRNDLLSFQCVEWNTSTCIGTKHVRTLARTVWVGSVKITVVFDLLVEIWVDANGYSFFFAFSRTLNNPATEPTDSFS